MIEILFMEVVYIALSLWWGWEKVRRVIILSPYERKWKDWVLLFVISSCIAPISMIGEL